MDAPRILIVDDAEPTRLILEHAFKGTGYDARSAGSASEARSLLRDFVPAVAVVDAILKEGSGYDVCRLLRTAPVYAATKIILISGVPEVQHEARKFPGAYDLFLDKPFSLRVLVEHLRRLAGPPAPLPA